MQIKTTILYYYTPLEWLKLKALQYQVLTRKEKKQTSHALQIGIQDDPTTLESSLAVYYKARHNIIQHSHS